MKMNAKKKVPRELVRQAIYLDIRMRSKIFSQEERDRLIEAGLLETEDWAIREAAASLAESRLSTISPLNPPEPAEIDF